MLEGKDLVQLPFGRLNRVGYALTVAYLIAIAYFSVRNLSAFDNIGPEGWGNFLAGVFAPLAFFWLVLGFLQQGHELRQSANALWLQSEELRHSVEQQRALVEATREQISFDRELLNESRADQERRRMPILKGRPRGGSTSGEEVIRYVQIENYGATCTNVRLELLNHDGEAIGSASQHEVAKGGLIDAQFIQSRKLSIDGILVYCRFVDTENVEGVRRFVISDDGIDGDYFSFSVNLVTGKA